MRTRALARLPRARRRRRRRVPGRPRSRAHSRAYARARRRRAATRRGSAPARTGTFRSDVRYGTLPPHSSRIESYLPATYDTAAAADRDALTGAARQYFCCSPPGSRRFAAALDSPCCVGGQRGGPTCLRAAQVSERGGLDIDQRLTMISLQGPSAYMLRQEHGRPRQRSLHRNHIEPASLRVSKPPR